MSENLDGNQSDKKNLGKEFLERVARLFSGDAAPSPLFADVSERLQQQEAAGLLRRLTEHVER